MVTSVGCFIVNNQNKILIGHPTWSSDGKGFWSIPKGKMDAGEDVKDTLEREVKEESNYSVQEFVSKGAHLVEVGVEVYRHKKKRIHAFALFLTQEVNEDPKCISYFDKKYPNGDPVPEFDRFDWVTYEEAIDKLHYTQADLLRNNKELFESRGGNK